MASKKKSQTNTYRANPTMLVVGIFFLLAGVFAQAGVLYKIFSSHPVPPGFTPAQAHSDPVMKFAMALFPLPFWLVGGWMVTYLRTFQITTSDKGVDVKLPFGKSWDAVWQDIRIKHNSTGEVVNEYELVSGKHRVLIQNYIKDHKKLRKEIETKIPLPVSPSKQQAARK